MDLNIVKMVELRDQQEMNHIQKQRLNMKIIH